MSRWGPGGYHLRMYAMPPAPLASHVLPGAQRALAWWGGDGLRTGSPARLALGPAILPALLVMVGLVVLTAWLVRRRPLWALALLLACCVAAVLTPSGWQPTLFAADLPLLPTLPVLLILLVGTTICVIAGTRPRRTSVTAALVSLGLLTGLLVAFQTGPLLVALRTGPLGDEVLGLVVTIAIAWLIGNSIRQSRTHAEELRTQAEAQAATAERLRIARELHDMVAHSIGIIAIQAGAGRRVIGTQPAEARDALAAIETTSRETLAGLRRMLGALRRADPGGEPGTAPLDPAPGLADVSRLATATADAGVLVDVQWCGQHRPLPADVDTSAFRIIQEAVTNVVRHAGTGHCRVSIDHQDDELSIEVVDDGCGGTTTGTGYGIDGMRERVGLLHGQFAAGPRPGGGFRVAARLPVPAAAR
jgi:signal transduction histidine kinase